MIIGFESHLSNWMLKNNSNETLRNDQDINIQDPNPFGFIRYFNDKDLLNAKKIQHQSLCFTLAKERERERERIYLDYSSTKNKSNSNSLFHSELNSFDTIQSAKNFDQILTI